MPFFIQRRGPSGKPQFMAVIDGAPTWTSDATKMTTWNSRQKASNVLAGQSEIEASGDPEKPGYRPAVAGFIKPRDKAEVRERP